MNGEKPDPLGKGPGHSNCIAKDDKTTVARPGDAAEDVTLAGALAWADRDFPVFPCGPNKAPLTRRGFHDATTDEARIRAWWTAHPGALIGMPTGAPSGITVLDVDTPLGPDALVDLRAEHDDLPDTYTVRTPSGGYHLWFHAWPGAKTAAGQLSEGLDTRGDGGYVIVPPSRGYEVKRNVPPAQAPAWLRERATKGAAPAPTTTPPATRALSNADRHYFERGVEEVSAALRRLPRPWHDGAGWDEGTMRGARDLVALGNTLGRDLREEFMAAAPHDAAWDERANKWQRAVEHVGGAVRTRPPSAIEEFWEGIPTAEPAPATVEFEVVADANHLPPLDVGNDSTAARWLARELGRGRLAGVFRRVDHLVRVPRIGEEGYVSPADERSEDGPAQVRIMTAGPLASMLHGQFDCYRTVTGADRQPRRKPSLFPITAARTAVDGLDDLRGVRLLRGVTHTPMLRRDGTVLDLPGYDDATGFLYLPDRGLAVPRVSDQPNRSEVGRARSFVLGMVCDFDFVTPSDLANFVGTLASPLLRHALSGPFAGVVIEAPQRGSGKSLLASLYRVTHGAVTRIETPPSEAEFEKELGAIFDTTTAPVIHFDNVTGTLRSPVLAGVLTSKTYGIRRLGSSERIETVNDRMFIFTGNNLSLGGDLARRMIHVRIDPGVPQPEMRTGFKITDLEGWAESHRGELLWALLTIARAWYADGRPGLPAEPRADTFAQVRESVGAMLSHAGFGGTFDAQETKPDDDGEDSQDWATFLTAVHAVFGTQKWRARDVVDKTRRSDAFDSDDTKSIRCSDLPGELPARHARFDDVSKSLGRWLANHRNQFAGGYRVVQDGSDKWGKFWRIETLEEAQSGGFTGLEGFSEALSGGSVTRMT